MNTTIPYVGEKILFTHRAMSGEGAGGEDVYGVGFVSYVDVPNFSVIAIHVVELSNTFESVDEFFFCKGGYMSLTEPARCDFKWESVE